MNRMLRCGALAGLAVGLSVAASAGGVLKRAAPRQQPAAPQQPAWLQPPGTVRSTQYLSASSGSPTARAAVDETDPRPIVWVVDGAGDLRGLSTALSRADMAAGNPAELAVFAWSHGYRKLLQDHRDMAHAKAQGARLAAKILEREQREPGRRVVLVGHSAGCTVALAAGESLPPDAIDRVVLLAPSVSTVYDIRPTLACAREGVDVFCSSKDWVALGIAMHLVGTSDDLWTSKAAGRYGFRPSAGAALSPAEAARLRQHFWNPEMARTGHDGGHYGVYATPFMHAYLFPLIGVRVP